MRVNVPHLAFTPPERYPSLPTLAEINPCELGDLVLALGTISFVGETLDLLRVDMSRLF